MSLQEQLKQVSDYKEQGKFLNRRDRIIKNHWRHGIVGVDDADSKKPLDFYERQRQERLSVEDGKNFINDRRKTCKYQLRFIQ